MLIGLLTQRIRVWVTYLGQAPIRGGGQQAGMGRVKAAWFSGAAGRALPRELGFVLLTAHSLAEGHGDRKLQALGPSVLWAKQPQEPSGSPSDESHRCQPVGGSLW